MCPGGLLGSTLCFCCSAAKSCPTLGDPMNCSIPGSLILHYLPVFAQTHVYWVSDAIQPSSVVPFSSCPQSFPTSGPFFSESVLHIRWPKDWSFRFSVSLSNEYSGLISFKVDCLIGLFSLLSKGLSRVFSNTTVWKHHFFVTQVSLWSNSHIDTWLLEKP